MINLSVLSIVIIMISQILYYNICAGSVYYVAKTGSDFNSGKQDQPWLTIQHAANVITAGDIVYIKSGTYNEKVIPKNSGNQDDYITYQNFPGEEVTINAGGNNAAIYIDKASYLCFVGLKLTGVSGGIFSSGGLYVLGPSSNIIVDNIVSTGNEANGILFAGVNGLIENIEIRNSEFSDNKLHGIVLWKLVYEALIDNNYIYNNGWRNDWGHGIKVVDFENVQGPVAVKITNNEISFSRTQGIQTWYAENILISTNYFHHNGATGIQIENGSKNIIVDNNICDFNALEYEYETGIWIQNSTNVIVQNNKLKGNGIGLILGESNKVISRRNIIYMNHGSVSTQSNAAGVIFSEGTRDAIFVHNILYRNGHSSSWRATFHLDKSISNHVIKNNIICESINDYDFWDDGTSYQINYNNYYNTRALKFYWQGNDLSWEDYLRQSGQDFNSHTNEPQFIDADKYDFRLQSNSVNINSGSHLTKTISSGIGKVVQVQDARYFTDGYNISKGDLITIGSNTAVRIIDVDYNNNTIIVDQSILWYMGDGVSYSYSGSAPDIGVYEYEESAPSPPSYLRIDK